MLKKKQIGIKKIYLPIKKARQLCCLRRTDTHSNTFLWTFASISACIIVLITSIGTTQIQDKTLAKIPLKDLRNKFHCNAILKLTSRYGQSRFNSSFPFTDICHPFKPYVLYKLRFIL